MIKLTRLSHEPLVLNSDLIEHLEMTPDHPVQFPGGVRTLTQVLSGHGE